MVSIEPPLPLTNPELTLIEPAKYMFSLEFINTDPPLPLLVALALTLLVVANDTVSPESRIEPPPVAPSDVISPELLTFAATNSITPPLLTIELALILPVLLIVEAKSLFDAPVVIITKPPLTSTIFRFSINELYRATLTSTPTSLFPLKFRVTVPPVAATTLLFTDLLAIK